MTDEATNGASPPVADAPAPLKSNDTSEMKVIAELGKADPAPKPEPEVEQGSSEASDPEVDEEQDDAPEADSEGQPKQGKNTWKKRLERARRQAVAETEARIYRELHVQREQAQPEGEQPASSKTFEQLLAENDFDHDKAMNAFYDQKRDAEKRQEAQKAEQEQHAKAAESLKAKVEAFEDKAGEGAWHEIVTSPLNTDSKFKPLVDLFMGDDHDLEIAHELAGDIEEAERLLSLSPLARVREVAKLAERFSGAPQKQAPVLPPKKTTSAPPPPKTVAGGGKSMVDLDDPNITTAQRIAEWKRSRGKS